MKRRMISDARWNKLEVGRDVTLQPVNRAFEYRLDHAGYGIPESSYYSGYVIYRRPDYIVLQDTDSFVVRRSEIAAAVVGR